MDTLPVSFGPPAFIVNPVIHQKLEWFGDHSHRACIEGFPAVVFKFKIWTEQTLKVEGNTPETLFGAVGSREVHGTLGLVTKETDVFHKQFLLLIYEGNRRVAELHGCMFTIFSQEYSLDVQHIVEAEFIAQNMELCKNE
jgi:hypothetical protein